MLPVEKSIVRFNQSSLGFVFPTAILANPMNDDLATGSLDVLPRPGITLSERMERLLESVDPYPLPGLHFFAQVLDTSTRSLQRRLAFDGVAFSEIVDRWRFKTALRLLDDSRLLIREISERLGTSMYPILNEPSGVGQRHLRSATGRTPCNVARNDNCG
jgi:AraC-like DNA-binding protein